MDKYDKVMKHQGFKKVKYPIGKPQDKGYAYWYVKEKVPYGSAISKNQLITIIDMVKRAK